MRRYLIILFTFFSCHSDFKSGDIVYIEEVNTYGIVLENDNQKTSSNMYRVQYKVRVYNYERYITRYIHKVVANAKKRH